MRHSQSQMQKVSNTIPPYIYCHVIAIQPHVCPAASTTCTDRQDTEDSSLTLSEGKPLPPHTHTFRVFLRGGGGGGRQGQGHLPL